MICSMYGVGLGGLWYEVRTDGQRKSKEAGVPSIVGPQKALLQ
jgi:hypothetical protein